ncbi:Outer membrane protein assembly factor BamE [Candidatus Hartigia pinicola]|nr:Outer membrane protein assembly factor BamE [Candidatus Hartigia pinicola]
MYYKLFTVIIVLLTLMSSGCSIMESFVYHPDINQGNYLTVQDVNKIKKGMTQKQIIYILGTPMVTDMFSGQIWYYIFRQELGHDPVKQETLTLNFDRDGILTNIHHHKDIIR